MNLIPFDYVFLPHFLSRLFGGEHTLINVCSVVGFLSRLFGGEHFRLQRSEYLGFLSRLFGGERKC